VTTLVVASAACAEFNVPCPPGHIVYDKRGCTRRNGVRTIGRTAMHSFFSPSDPVRELMGTDCSVLDFIRKAKEEGFKTIIEHALRLWLVFEPPTCAYATTHSVWRSCSSC
jgi:type II secretory ATPase GspE/PulE/Tfp pilus assembly ATPase PilB-like protein